MFKPGDIVRGVQYDGFWGDHELPFIGRVKGYDQDGDVEFAVLAGPGKPFPLWAVEKAIEPYEEYIIDKVLAKYADEV
jgi:hypothetical protein